MFAFIYKLVCMIYFRLILCFNILFDLLLFLIQMFDLRIFLLLLFWFIFAFIFTYRSLLFRSNVRSCSTYAMPVAGEIKLCAVLSMLARYNQLVIVHRFCVPVNLSNSIWNVNRKASSNIYASVIGVQHPSFTAEYQ